MKNYHIIKFKFLGPTDTLSSRIKLSSGRFGSSKTIALKYNDMEPMEQAIEYLIDREFNIIGKAEGDDCMYIISDTFKNITL